MELSGLEIVGQQLALCQQQDRLLDKNETRLHAKKTIAQHMADHKRTE